VRNQLFDLGVLKSQGFDLPVISVGNLTVGGTGKTPHVGYLIRLLSREHKVAVLSRGYKRRTRGYVLATSKSTAHDIGDEPYQIKSKFPRVTVAVDADRREGIRRLHTDRATRGVEVVILDDAFQHRYVRPGLSILLVDYNRPIMDDALLPAGRLREPRRGKRRADIVIVTKCPADMSSTECRHLAQRLHLASHQTLYFSTMAYQELQPIFCGDSRPLEDLHGDEHILLVSGIAEPGPMVSEIKQHCTRITHLEYGDHHDFSEKDIETLNCTFEALPHPRIAITTEKDAARLVAAGGLSENLRHNFFMLPIEVRILQDKETSFNHKILDYVRQNPTNGILDKRKDDHKS